MKEFPMGRLVWIYWFPQFISSRGHDWIINSHLSDVDIYAAIERSRNSTVRKISIYISFMKNVTKINSVKFVEELKPLIYVQ